MFNKSLLLANSKNTVSITFQDYPIPLPEIPETQKLEIKPGSCLRDYGVELQYSDDSEYFVFPYKDEYIARYKSIRGGTSSPLTVDTPITEDIIVTPYGDILPFFAKGTEISISVNFDFASNYSIYGFNGGDYPNYPNATGQCSIIKKKNLDGIQAFYLSKNLSTNYFYLGLFTQKHFRYATKLNISPAVRTSNGQTISSAVTKEHLPRLSRNDNYYYTTIKITGSNLKFSSGASYTISGIVGQT